jgi:hypothetical protein
MWKYRHETVRRRWASRGIRPGSWVLLCLGLLLLPALPARAQLSEFAGFPGEYAAHWSMSLARPYPARAPLYSYSYSPPYTSSYSRPGLSAPAPAYIPARSYRAPTYAPLPGPVLRSSYGGGYDAGRFSARPMGGGYDAGLFSSRPMGGGYDAGLFSGRR